VTEYACVRCSHPFAEHVAPDTGEYLDCQHEDCECEGFTDEPSESQLDSLYNVDRMSAREEQWAAWEQKVMLDRSIP
jgi:hypothetical protein